MFTTFLFIVFLSVYFYLFVPSHPNRPLQTVAAIAPAVEVELPVFEPADLPDVALEEVSVASVAKAIPVNDLVITAEELEAIAGEPTPAKEISNSEPLQAIADYSQMGCVELRKICTAQGIKWKNAYGKNKHLSTSEMREALTAR